VQFELRRAAALHDATAAGIREADPEVLARAFAQATSPHAEPAARQEAFRQVMMHGFDLPDAPLRSMGDEYASAVRTMAREQAALGDHRIPAARAWVRMRDVLGLDDTAAMNDQQLRTRVQELLSVSELDPNALAIAHVELLERGLLQRVAPEVAATHRARLAGLLSTGSERSPSTHFALARVSAQVDAIGALDQLAARVVREPVSSSYQQMRAIEDAASLPAADLVDQMPFAARATVVGNVVPNGFEATSHWLKVAGATFADERASALGPVRTQLQQLVDHNLERLAGRTPRGATAGYGRHPDYAELGRIRSGAELLGRIARAEAAAADAGAVSVAAPPASGGYLQW
jgi:hypothetical protein